MTVLGQHQQLCEGNTLHGTHTVVFRTSPLEHGSEPPLSRVLSDIHQEVEDQVEKRLLELHTFTEDDVCLFESNG